MGRRRRRRKRRRAAVSESGALWSSFISQSSHTLIIVILLLYIQVIYFSMWRSVTGSLFIYYVSFLYCLNVNANNNIKKKKEGKENK